MKKNLTKKKGAKSAPTSRQKAILLSYERRLKQVKRYLKEASLRKRHDMALISGIERKLRKEDSEYKSRISASKKNLLELIKKRDRMQAEMLNLASKKQALLKQLNALEDEVKERQSFSAELQNKIDYEERKLAMVKSEMVNLKMANLMVNLFLAADAKGIEDWLTKDSQLLLEYVRSTGSSSFNDFYKRSLYEALLGKAYRFYRCNSCKKAFHSADAEPICCPYCSSTKESLSLLDVFKEGSESSGSGISLIPTPR
ncbi:MAG: hypothetical protein QXX17_01155 [Conexivisphaerales archaeon]